MPDTGPDATKTRYGSNSGQPLTRRDGIAKVTGAAPYAADNLPNGCLHAVMAVSSIARGRVASMDVEAAKAHPGVVEVITPENRGKLALEPGSKPTMFSFKTELLDDHTVRYAKQPIALVVAETLEAATEGAALLAPTYEVEAARIGFDGGVAFDPEAVGMGEAPDFETGEAQTGAGDRVVEAQYETPHQYHNALEPHAVVAQWDGDNVTIDLPNQALGVTKSGYAAWFGIPEENVLLRSPFLGGGFGSKAVLYGPLILGPLAARMLGRPVKLALRRDQMFGPVGHRGATRQTLRLGLNDEGQLTALDHHARSSTSSFENFLESAANASHNVYASPAISTGHGGLREDIGTPCPTRAPGEASGSAALECAIDEAAYACGMDPLDFRLANYAETHPTNGKPFSSKALRECYSEAAKAFGWAGRPLEPRSMRSDDGYLLGWGMGTALFPCPMFAAEARATLRMDGTATVETGACDMGQGAWTSLAQIGADGLAMDLDNVEFRAGSSDLPDAGVAGGSGHTATAGTALHHAGRDVIRQLTEIALKDPDSPLFGADNEGVEARDGRLHRIDDDGRSESFADILSRAGLDQIVGEGTGKRDDPAADKFAMSAHGAVFAEVRVDPDLYQIRVTRLVGAFAAGRIINPRLARSQLQGGMIWGLSFALHEDGIHDTRSGRPMNADLAEYHVPVNADAPSVEAITVNEDDPYVNPLGVKGVGEIGITGTVGAIANAVWHATGKRIRAFPIGIEDLAG